MRHTLEEKLEILRTEKSYLLEKYGVTSIGIFGSYAKGLNTEKSDCDIVIEISKPMGFFDLFRLENYLSEKLDVNVDLGTKNSIKPYVKEEILKTTVYA